MHQRKMLPEYIFPFEGLSGREKFYTWIPDARKILDKLWAEKKDLKDFIIKAHKIKEQKIK